jgi:hypothetical protein
MRSWLQSLCEAMILKSIKRVSLFLIFLFGGCGLINEQSSFSSDNNKISRTSGDAVLCEQVLGRGPSYEEAKAEIKKRHRIYKTAWEFCSSSAYPKPQKTNWKKIERLRSENTNWKGTSSSNSRSSTGSDIINGDRTVLSYERAEAVCKPQAELASEQAAATYTPRRSRLRTYDVSCSQYGRYSVNCSARDMTPTGGKWAGINKALEKKRLKDKTYNAVFDSCMAQMGHF